MTTETLYADEVFANSVPRARSFQQDYINRHQSDRLAALGQVAVPAVGNIIMGGLWTWGAVACFAAGGSWVILGAFCVLSVVGCAMILVGQTVYVLKGGHI